MDKKMLNFYLSIFATFVILPMISSPKILYTLFANLDASISNILGPITVGLVGGILSLWIFFSSKAAQKLLKLKFYIGTIKVIRILILIAGQIGSGFALLFILLYFISLPHAGDGIGLLFLFLAWQGFSFITHAIMYLLTFILIILFFTWRVTEHKASNAS